jgi:hypothetical protein
VQAAVPVQVVQQAWQALVETPVQAVQQAWQALVETPVRAVARKPTPTVMALPMR